MKPHLIFRILRLSNWSIKFHDNALEVNSTNFIKYNKIQKITKLKGVVFDTILIKSGGETFQINKVLRFSSKRLHSALAIITSLYESIEHLSKYTNANKYFCNRDFQSLVTHLNEKNITREKIGFISNYLTSQRDVPNKLLVQVSNIDSILSGSRRVVDQWNEGFIAQEIEQNKSFFQTIDAHPLTSEQAETVATFEDRTLLIASAGSGKTSTIIAKIAYAIKNKLANPEEILVLAFNKSAKEEIQKRCTERVSRFTGNASSVDVNTFHGFGLKVITQSIGIKPTIASWVGGVASHEEKIISDIVSSLVNESSIFRDSLTSLLTVWENPLDFDLAWLSQEEDGQTDLKKRLMPGNSVHKRASNPSIQTLKGDFVRSNEECAIANWLFIHGINYDYEKPFHARTATKNFRQYIPDFYYPDIDCWHEHFALNKYGRPPHFFDGDYLSGVKWKRETHTTYNSCFFETHSAHFSSNTIFKLLDKCVRDRGLNPERKTVIQVFQDAEALGLSSFYALFRACIKHIKLNDIPLDSLRLRADMQRNPGRAHAFLDVLIPVLNKYQEKLTESNSIDFEDMIQQACQAISLGQFKKEYKLIIIDEFQDISTSRAELIKLLLEKDHTTQLLAVGDDWQSIYRFAGSDISIMTRFVDHFGFSKIKHLTTTYRSNQGIAVAAARFIQQNPFQLKKNVKSVDHTSTGVMQIVPYTSQREYNLLLDQCLADIAIHHANEKCTVFILGRYNHIEPDNMAHYSQKYANSISLSYMTFHRAKGSQADYVIVVGLNDNSSGLSFPSNIADDPLVNVFLPFPEDFPYSEERRLFYVALTRARHKVFLFVDGIHPSPFVGELVSLQNGGVVEGVDQFERCKNSVCPSCGEGLITLRQGKYGSFHGCSKYPACTFTKKLNKSTEPF